jgi:hypothetical protein
MSVTMAYLARDAIDEDHLTTFSDRGYFKSEEILRCGQDGIKTLVPKPPISNGKAEGRFDDAIDWIESPTTSARDISSRSASVSDNLERCRCGGRIPPVSARTPWTDEGFRSKN